MALREPKTPITVAELLDEELYGVVLQAAGESAALTGVDGAIHRALIAAEDDYERDLQIRFQGARVLSDVYNRQQQPIASGLPGALPADYDPLKDIDEAAYDYATDFFAENRHGELLLNYRPIRSIEQMFFVFPGSGPVWFVPPPWRRLDRRTGMLQVTPGGTNAIYATFNSFIMSAISAGRGLPQSVHVDYTVGFVDGELEAHHNDLLEGVRLRAMLGALGLASTAAAPAGVTGGSLSLDGLSRSRSFGGKYGPYSGKIELALAREQAIRANWKRREQGLAMAFMGAS